MAAVTRSKCSTVDWQNMYSLKSKESAQCFLFHVHHLHWYSFFLWSFTHISISDNSISMQIQFICIHFVLQWKAFFLDNVRWWYLNMWSIIVEIMNQNCHVKSKNSQNLPAIYASGVWFWVMLTETIKLLLDENEAWEETADLISTKKWNWLPESPQLFNID